MENALVKVLTKLHQLPILILLYLSEPSTVLTQSNPFHETLFISWCSADIRLVFPLTSMASPSQSLFLAPPPLRDSKYWCPPGLSLWPSFSSNFNLSLSYVIPSNGYKCHQYANDSQIYFFSCNGLKTCPQIFCCTSYQTWNTIPLPLNMSQPQ